MATSIPTTTVGLSGEIIGGFRTVETTLSEATDGQLFADAVALQKRLVASDADIIRRLLDARIADASALTLAEEERGETTLSEDELVQMRVLADDGQDLLPSQAIALWDALSSAREEIETLTAALRDAHADRDNGYALSHRAEADRAALQAALDEARGLLTDLAFTKGGQLYPAVGPVAVWINRRNAFLSRQTNPNPTETK